MDSANNFTYGRSVDGVQLITLRGHRLSEMCANAAEIDAAIQMIKDELDRTAEEMKAALETAVEVDP